MGLQAEHFLLAAAPFVRDLGHYQRRDFTEGSRSPLSWCARSLRGLLQLSRRLLQTLRRVLEIRGEKVMSSLTFHPCFQLLSSAACYIFFLGTSSEVHYEMSTPKQKPQPCSRTMIPEQSRAHRGTRSPLLNSASLGGELLLAFVGCTCRFHRVTLLAKAVTEAPLSWQKVHWQFQFAYRAARSCLHIQPRQHFARAYDWRFSQKICLTGASQDSYSSLHYLPSIIYHLGGGFMVAPVLL